MGRKMGGWEEEETKGLNGYIRPFLLKNNGLHTPNGSFPERDKFLISITKLKTFFKPKEKKRAINLC